MEAEISLPCSLESATGLYPEPDESSPLPHFHVTFPCTPRTFKGPPPSSFPTKTLYTLTLRFSPMLAILPANHTLQDFIILIIPPYRDEEIFAPQWLPPRAMLAGEQAPGSARWSVVPGPLGWGLGVELKTPNIYCYETMGEAKTHTGVVAPVKKNIWRGADTINLPIMAPPPPAPEPPHVCPKNTKPTAFLNPQSQLYP
jgi:hypothetical protein